MEHPTCSTAEAQPYILRANQTSAAPPGYSMQEGDGWVHSITASPKLQQQEW